MNNTVNSGLDGVLILSCTQANICAFDFGTSGRLRFLTPDCKRACANPDVAPDGEWIVFDKSPTRGTSDLWQIRTNGTDMHRIVANEEYWWQPKWSPTGSAIAFWSLEDPYLPPNSTLTVYRRGSLYTMNPEGKEIRRLTPQEGQVLGLDWAPDGEWLVVSARLEDLNQDGVIDREDRARLYIVHGTRGEIELLRADVAPSLSMHKPTWSPAGDHIAYIEGHGHLESYGDLVVVTAAEGTEIARIDIGVAAAYRWAPDGTEIAYVRHDFVEDGIGMYTNLFVFDLTSGEIRRLTDTSTYSIYSSYDEGGVTLNYPIWSPDGHHIAFTWRTAGDAYVVVVGADGTNLSRITGAGLYRLFAWSE